MARPEDRGLDRERHAGLERRQIFQRDERVFMHVEADRVPGSVPKPFAIPSILDHLAAGSIDLARRHTGARGLDAGGLRGDDELVYPPKLGIGLAHEDGTTEVRAIAVDDRAKVERHRGAL